MKKETKIATIIFFIIVILIFSIPLSQLYQIHKENKFCESKGFIKKSMIGTDLKPIEEGYISCCKWDETHMNLKCEAVRK